ncbi:MAG: ScpA family protein [Nanoarchaeota archaeon]
MTKIPNKGSSKIGQEQIHGLLFGEQLSWQAIIYDLINSEQLDPWDIDLVLLTNKYLERVKKLEEENFFVSSKVLFAAALLLRIKSEILLNHYIPSLDNILFGKEESKSSKQERLELDEEIPELVPRTPLPRFKKVTLQELMGALGKAIKTENRRIRRVVIAKQHEFETAITLPRTRVNLKDQVRDIYMKIRGIFAYRKTKLAFSELSGVSNEEKISAFIPLLHLDNQHKIHLEQENHFEEIWILLKHLYEEQNAEELERMKKEVEEAFKESELETEKGKYSEKHK